MLLEESEPQLQMEFVGTLNIVGANHGESCLEYKTFEPPLFCIKNPQQIENKMA